MIVVRRQPVCTKNQFPETLPHRDVPGGRHINIRFPRLPRGKGTRANNSKSPWVPMAGLAPSTERARPVVLRDSVPRRARAWGRRSEERSVRRAASVRALRLESRVATPRSLQAGHDGPMEATSEVIGRHLRLRHPGRFDPGGQ